MTTNRKTKHIKAALQILALLGLPRPQQNERSALCLLALLNLTPGKPWSMAEAPLMGITPIMDWAREHYAKDYAPNTRETVRRQSIHQFIAAGLALYNPDKPDRPVNSPMAVYQIEPAALALLRTFGTSAWSDNLQVYLSERGSLAARYANEREQTCVPVRIAPGQQIALSHIARPDRYRPCPGAPSCLSCLCGLLFSQSAAEVPRSTGLLCYNEPGAPHHPAPAMPPNQPRTVTR